MKKTTFALLFAIAILGSCKKDDAADNTKTLGVDVQSYFNNDLIQVFVDGQQMINRSLKTDLSIGYCVDGGKIIVKETPGSHELKAIVKNNASLTESFVVNNDHYVGISYDSLTNKVSFTHQDHPFIYH